tara:strand:- start:38 stop:274 length:237 start_codon:yes stop_codon:yes gene_type:complete
MEQQHPEHNTDKDYTDEFVFLYQLQDSGSINMHAGPRYLEKAFGLNKKESKDIFVKWTKVWNTDDYQTANKNNWMSFN